MKKISLRYLQSIISALLIFIPSANSIAGDAEKTNNSSWYYTQNSESLKAMTPELALKQLKEGNVRFVKGQMKKRNLLQQAKLTKQGQYPFAVILSCMDSRGSPELIFDQGIGDIFSVRVAGNVVDDDQLGSMEFATKAVGSHIIVVMGHTRCGAMRGACSGVELGHLTQLLNKITPAANTVKQTLNVATLDCNDTKIVDDIAKQNVLDMIKEIKDNSPIISSLVDQKQVMIVGAMHDLQTGQVTFFQ